MTFNSFVFLRALRGKKNANAGFTIVELIAAIMVVTVCMAAFVKIAHVARQQRDYGREHQTAVDQTLNVLELLVTADPVQLAAGDVDLTTHESLIARSLPDGKLLITCEQLAVDDATVDIWQLNATVTWKPGANLPQRSVTLSRLRTSGFGLQEEETNVNPEEAGLESEAPIVNSEDESLQSEAGSPKPEEGGAE